MQFIQCNDRDHTRINMDNVVLFYDYGTLAIRVSYNAGNVVLSYESTESRDKDLAEMDLYLIMHTE